MDIQETTWERHVQLRPTNPLFISSDWHSILRGDVNGQVDTASQDLLVKFEAKSRAEAGVQLGLVGKTLDGK